MIFRAVDSGSQNKKEREGRERVPRASFHLTAFPASDVCHLLRDLVDGESRRPHAWWIFLEGLKEIRYVLLCRNEQEHTINHPVIIVVGSKRSAFVLSYIFPRSI